MTSPITYDASSWLAHYGAFSSGRPWGRVVHSLECSPVPGIARELSAHGGYLDNEGLAPHGMSDPTQRVRACSTRYSSGHVGPLANPHVVGYEVSGRAGNTRAQWLDGGNQQAALESDAKLIAWDCAVDGWSRAEIRALSGAQIQQNYRGGPYVRGLLSHNDVSQFIGGTNHWDPGPDFPWSWFLDRVRAYYDVFKGTTPPPPPKDWFDMATLADLEKVVDKVVNARVPGIIKALVPGMVHDELQKTLPGWFVRSMNIMTDGKGNAGFNKDVNTTVAEGTGGAKATQIVARETRDVARAARTEQAANAKTIAAIRTEAAAAARAAVVVQARIERMLNSITDTPATPDPPPVPPPPVTTRPTSHTLATGQTLTAVAGLYGLTLAQLLAANPGVKNPDVVDVGTVLVIPPKA